MGHAKTAEIALAKARLLASELRTYEPDGWVEEASDRLLLLLEMRSLDFQLCDYEQMLIYDALLTYAKQSFVEQPEVKVIREVHERVLNDTSAAEDFLPRMRTIGNVHRERIHALIRDVRSKLI